MKLKVTIMIISGLLVGSLSFFIFNLLTEKKTPIEKTVANETVEKEEEVTQEIQESVQEEVTEETPIEETPVELVLESKQQTPVVNTNPTKTTPTIDKSTYETTTSTKEEWRDYIYGMKIKYKITETYHVYQDGSKELVDTKEE